MVIHSGVNRTACIPGHSQIFLVSYRWLEGEQLQIQGIRIILYTGFYLVPDFLLHLEATNRDSICIKPLKRTEEKDEKYSDCYKLNLFIQSYYDI